VVVVVVVAVPVAVALDSLFGVATHFLEAAMLSPKLTSQLPL
jgi:hypothetical protein